MKKSASSLFYLSAFQKACNVSSFSWSYGNSPTGQLFLNIPGRLAGFSIISPTGIVIFFDEDPNIITVIGKKRKSGGQDAGKLSPAVQLMKIHYRADEDGIFFRDNSGAAIEPEGLVPLFIRWVSEG